MTTTFQSDEQALCSIEEAFAGIPRPKKFTVEDGDPECMLHDAMWHRVTPETIVLEDVFPELSFPFNELLGPGVAYYLPAVTRLVLKDNRTFGWSGVAFVDGFINRLRPKDCSEQQRIAVFELISYLIQCKQPLIDDQDDLKRMQQIADKWSSSPE